MSKRFLCSYRFEGHEWNFLITAKDWAEAERRLFNLKLNVTLDGEHIDTFPNEMGWFVKAVTWVQNRWVDLTSGGR